MLEAAVAALGPEDPRRADVLALLAVELYFSPDADRRLALAEEALPLARGSGDPGRLAEVLDRYLYATWFPDTLEERLALAAEQVALTEGMPDPLLRQLAANRRLYIALEAGDIDLAEACAADSRAIAGSVPQPLLRWTSLYQSALLALVRGELEEAESLAEQAVELGSESGQPDAMMIFFAQLMAIRRDQKRLAEVLELIEDAVEQNPGLPAWRAFLAVAYLQGDRHDDARAQLEALGDATIPRDFLQLASLHYLADVCAELEIADRAASVYATLAPWAGQCATTGISLVGAADHALGRLAATLGRREEAEAHFAAAAALHARMRAPVLLARTEEAWGSALLALGRPEDTERAEAMLRSALAAARERGAEDVAHRAETALAAISQA